MSVERSSVRIAPNPTPATSAKPPSATDEQSADAAGGSFMALLATSIESSANTAAQPLAVPPAGAPEGERLPLAALPYAPVQNLGADGQGPETAAVAWLDGVAQPTGDWPTAGTPIQPGALQSSGLFQAPEISGNNGRGQQADAGHKPPGPQTAQDAGGAATTGQTLLIDPLATGAGPAASGAAGVGRVLPEAVGVSSAKAAATRANEIRLEADTLATGRLNAQSLPMAAGSEPGLWLALNQAAGKPGQNTRAADRPTSGALTDLATSAGTGPWAEAARAGDDAATALTYSPDAGAPTPAAAVAEKLHYWIARGVQNAQLQLDAFGGGSVEVRILVQGNEAQVEFRSDQPEARKMLQDSMAQLKDMLKGEGLALSGGFVGSSAHQGSGARERQANAPGSTVSLVIDEPRLLVAGNSAARASGRSVDVFV